MSLAGMAEMVWRPKFTYLDCDVPISFELLIPMRPWDYRSGAVGGHDTATSGIDESFVIRHDRLYNLHLRLTEEEWVQDVEPMIRTLWAQAQEFTIQLDANDVGTVHDVRLVSPWMGDGIQPSRHTANGVLELDLTVRTADGSRFSYPYFPSLSGSES
jgi:hypothetical protein